MLNSAELEILNAYKNKNIKKFSCCFSDSDKPRLWSGGAMVLGKLPVPGRPTIWVTIGQGPTALAGRCRWGLFGHFYPHLSFLSSFSLPLGDGPI